MTTRERLRQDLQAIYLGNLFTVEADLKLPSEGRHGSRFTWASDQPHLLDATGHVTRPDAGKGNRKVRLTATASLNEETASRTFEVTILEAARDLDDLTPVPLRFELPPDQDEPPAVGIVRDHAGILSVVPVRWRWSEETPIGEDTHTIRGFKAYAKGDPLLEDQDKMAFRAEVTSTESPEPYTKPEPVLQELPKGSVRITEHRFDVNRRNMIAYLLTLDVDRLLYSFRKSAGLDTRGAPPMEGWDAPESKLRGHTTGHVLSAWSLAYADMADGPERDVMHDKIRRLTEGLREVQEAFHTGGLANYGYLSAYSEEQFDLLEAYTPYPEIWAPYYTLHKLIAGLLDAHEHAGFDTALEVVSRMMHWLRRRLLRLSRSTRQGMWAMYIAGEYGGMNDVIARYLRVTGDRDAVDLFHAFDNDKLFYPMAHELPALNGMHANQHIPQIVGAQTYYRETGDPRYGAMAAYFWELVSEHHSFCNGGVGEGEMFREPDRIAAHITDKNTESCASYNMLKLTRSLHVMAPQPRYVAYYERTLLNHVLPSAEYDAPTGGTTYFMPLEPGATLSYDEDGNSCCHGTGMESQVTLNEGCYYLETGEGDPTLRVECYLASEVKLPDYGIAFRQVRSVKATRSAEYVIDTTGRYTLKFRHPDWVDGPMTLRVQAHDVVQEAGEGYTMVTAAWNPGDRIIVELPFRLTIERTADDPTIGSLYYGPYLMTALSDAAAYLTLDDADTIRETWQPIEGEEERLGHRWGELHFAAHEMNQGEAYHAYFKIKEGLT